MTSMLVSLFIVFVDGFIFGVLLMNVYLHRRYRKKK